MINFQIETLHLKSDSDPETKHIVDALEKQLEDIQLQVAAAGDAPAAGSGSGGRPPSAVRPKTAGGNLVTAALQVILNRCLLVIIIIYSLTLSHPNR